MWLIALQWRNGTPRHGAWHGSILTPPELLTEIATEMAIEKELMRALEAVPEAFHYVRPSSLVRGIRLDFGAVSRLPRPRINLNMRWFPVKGSVANFGAGILIG